MKLQDYIKECLENPITIKLKNNVLLYGTGTIAGEVKTLLEGKGYQVDAVLNSSKSFLNVIGMDTLLPEEYCPEKRQAVSVVIAVFNYKANIKLIVKRLKELGYTNLVTYPMLMEMFPGEIKNTFYLCSNKQNKRYEKEIEICRNLWADEESINVYEAIIRFRFSKKLEDLMEPDKESRHYFPFDIKGVNPKGSIRLIDCGAYDGDTIKEFLDINGELEGLAAFEPDSENYKKLCEFLKKEQDKIKERIVLPCGLSDQAKIVRFSEGGGTGSAIDEAGSTFIQCVTLDDSIPDFNPNVIKMDIEGSEYDTLIGAEKTIKSLKPSLMICVYHLPEDIFRIPLLIKQWNLGYRLYLRVYEKNGLEMVMYATIE